MSPSGELDPQVALLQGSAAELMQFTVLGIIDSVMLVLHKTTNETYILKVGLYFFLDCTSFWHCQRLVKIRDR